MENKKIQRGRRKSEYRTEGFISGLNQLKVGELKYFERTVCRKLGISTRQFKRIRDFGSKSKPYIESIESVFSMFGITSNIWDKKNN